MLSGFGQTAVTLCCMTIALLIIAFCYFGSYTKKVHLQGVIVPSTGLISVRTNYQGSIQTLNVQEGQLVQKGTELFTISNDTYDKKGASIYNSLKSSLEQQYSSLLGQKDYEALIVNSKN
ncbi:probable secretion protein [Vibrio maritimus]|uniref:Probable secretion protein n=1 Tax=Vibrio maritimus TaxID=990268 RepID=A0A090U1L2_9VIBR|nr:probable secretion protein [Vibrio maritimus]